MILDLLGLKVSKEGHRKQKKQIITYSGNSARPPPAEPSASSWGCGKRPPDPEPAPVETVSLPALD